MTTFVDTSALYALLDENDTNHRQAARWLAGPGRSPREVLLSHNYVIVEATAVAQRHLGKEGVRKLLSGLVPGLDIVFVDEELHAVATVALLASGTKRVSLVDRVSFELMRRRGIEQAFAFDRDFKAEGFRTVP